MARGLLRVRVLRSHQDPPRGWRSARYGCRVVGGPPLWRRTGLVACLGTFFQPPPTSPQARESDEHNNGHSQRHEAPTIGLDQTSGHLSRTSEWRYWSFQPSTRASAGFHRGSTQDEHGQESLLTRALHWQDVDTGLLKPSVSTSISPGEVHSVPTKLDLWTFDCHKIPSKQLATRPSKIPCSSFSLLGDLDIFC